MKKTEKVFQSDELAKNWESVGAYRPWWFDTSTKYAKIYTFDGKGIPIVWDDEETEFTVEETRECTGDGTCALVLSNKKKRALVLVHRDLPHVMIHGSIEKKIEWQEYTKEGLWAAKKHCPGYKLEAVIMNPKIKTLEKLSVVKGIIRKVMEAKINQKGGNDEPAPGEDPKDQEPVAKGPAE